MKFSALGLATLAVAATAAAATENNPSQVNKAVGSESLRGPGGPNANKEFWGPGFGWGGPWGFGVGPWGYGGGWGFGRGWGW